MGIVARTYETSQFALGIHTFQEWFDPVILGPKDQPHVAPAFVPLMESVKNQIDASKAAVKAEYDQDFVNRTQSGMPPWAGPPGAPELRDITTPEQAGGDLFNWVA